MVEGWLNDVLKRVVSSHFENMIPLIAGDHGVHVLSVLPGERERGREARGGWKETDPT